MQQVTFVASWRPEVSSVYKNKADAQKVAEEVFALGEHPETEEILEMAKDETKECHKLIEWDDTKAAGKYRLWQVRHFLNDLQIVEIGLNKEKKPDKIGVPLKMYHSLKGETGYRPLPLIIQDENLHKKLLLTALSELNAFTNKYSTLTELEPVFKAIRELNIPPDKPAA